MIYIQLSQVIENYHSPQLPELITSCVAGMQHHDTANEMPVRSDNECRAEIYAALSTAAEAAIDRHIDDVARSLGYGRVGVSPSASCIGYAAYPGEYQAEAIAFGQWMASLWPFCYQIMDDVAAGLREIPNAPQLISELPEFSYVAD